MLGSVQGTSARLQTPSRADVATPVGRASLTTPTKRHKPPKNPHIQFLKTMRTLARNIQKHGLRTSDKLLMQDGKPHPKLTQFLLFAQTVFQDINLHSKHMVVAIAAAVENAIQQKSAVGFEQTKAQLGKLKIAFQNTFGIAPQVTILYPGARSETAEAIITNEHTIFDGEMADFISTLQEIAELSVEDLSSRVLTKVPHTNPTIKTETYVYKEFLDFGLAITKHGGFLNVYKFASQQNFEALLSLLKKLHRVFEQSNAYKRNGDQQFVVDLETFMDYVESLLYEGFKDQQKQVFGNDAISTPHETDISLIDDVHVQWLGPARLIFSNETVARKIQGEIDANMEEGAQAHPNPTGSYALESQKFLLFGKPPVSSSTPSESLEQNAVETDETDYTDQEEEVTAFFTPAKALGGISPGSQRLPRLSSGGKSDTARAYVRSQRLFHEANVAIYPDHKPSADTEHRQVVLEFCSEKLAPYLTPQWRTWLTQANVKLFMLPQKTKKEIWQIMNAFKNLDPVSHTFYGIPIEELPYVTEATALFLSVLCNNRDAFAEFLLADLDFTLSQISGMPIKAEEGINHFQGQLDMEYTVTSIKALTLFNDIDKGRFKFSRATRSDDHLVKWYLENFDTVYKTRHNPVLVDCAATIAVLILKSRRYHTNPTYTQLAARMLRTLTNTPTLSLTQAGLTQIAMAHFNSKKAELRRHYADIKCST